MEEIFFFLNIGTSHKIVDAKEDRDLIGSFLGLSTFPGHLSELSAVPM